MSASKNLFPTLILIGTAFFLVFSIYFLTSSFYKSLHLAEESAQKRLETIAKTLSITIDGDKFEEMMRKHPNKDAISENSDDPFYNDLHTLLAYTKDINNLSSDIYTWVVNDKNPSNTFVEFAVTSGETPYFRHPWNDFPDEMIPIFYIGGELDEYRDKNGRWISYFYPIYNSKGKPVGAVQADISYDLLVSEIKSSALKKGLGLLITVLFFIVILMWVLDRLHKKQTDLLETQILEEKYRELIDSSLDFIFTIDLDKRINYMNKVFLGYYGDHNMIGKSFSDIVSKSQMDEGMMFMDNLLLNPKSSKKEFLIQSPEGNNVWMEMLFVPTLSNEEISGFQVTGRDVTEKKKLKHRVDQERVKAIHSLKSKENFFANMSHEIRTPLNAIIGMESLIDKENLPKQEQDYLSNIKLSAKGLLQIINDILDYSKIEAGKLTIEKIPFKVQSIIDTVNRTFNFKFEEKGVDLIIDFEPGLKNIVIESDLLRLNQVMINLVSNALKFTEKGSVTISIKIEGEKKPNLKVAIRDTGIGIPRDKKNKLFESFTQAKGDTARKFGGTGLGLAICKKITKLLGGDIEFDSTEGVGTEFNFFVPITISDEVLEEVQTVEEIDVSSLKNIKILVAEDNPINTVYISGLLDDLGLSHDTVENGQEAIDKVNEASYDVVLMDVQMPVMNGLEAAKYIREELKDNIPIIALTANAFPEDKKRFLEGGMDGFVTKPFEQHDLVNELTRLLKDFKPTENEETSNSDMNIEQQEVYSLSKLESISNGNEAFLNKMITIFLEEAPVNIALFDELRSCEDVIKLGQLAHKIKPTADMFQITKLSVLTREVEKLAKEESPNKKALQGKADLIIEQLKYVLDDLKSNRS